MSSAANATQRLQPKRQTLDEAYAPPANFLEIEVVNPITHGVGKMRYTDYEIRLRSNLPVFKQKESSVRRRYSDFDWLRGELERDSKIVVPPLPSKSLKRQLPFRSDDGIFEEEFIENRRKGLEVFINKSITGDDLALLEIVVPPLPSKSLKRQLPFRSDDGIFEEEFIENRRKGLEVFINK
ncbi:unnamed protein product [Nippostrongylus brasiliensis]|uniref:Sorting nexin-3 n=1 Tax=Nippostrongylus brasiliensis TaxID=27835 RepID=A0A0N4YBP5_NIPBR|nr:unnamed protein product [Nippostrongylus brasiliensis]